MNIRCNKFFRSFNFVTPVLLAGLVAGCSGGSTYNVAPSPAPTYLATSTTVANSWSAVKWGGGGYVTGILYHPTTPNIRYARTDVGGAYRWDPVTSSWTPITDGLGFEENDTNFHAVESLAVDPTNDQLLYLVAGNNDKTNGRIYISNDRGNHWTWVTLPFPVMGNGGGRAMGERLQLDPTNPSTMFYGSRTAGLWKSSDSGHTWSRLNLGSVTMSGSAMGVEKVIFDNSNVGGGGTTWIIYAAVAPDYANAAGLTSSLYKSTNGGFSWTPVTVPTPATGYYIPHMVRSTDGTYYVAFNKNAGEGVSGPSYLYKYVPFNGTWTQLNSSTSGGFGGVSIYGSGATTRIALAITGWASIPGQPGQEVQLSDNAGATWREIEYGMGHTPTANDTKGWNDDIEIDPFNRDHIAHLGGSGIVETWSASSATPWWNNLVPGMEETATLALSTPPAGAPYKMIDSAGDIGTWVYTDLTTKATEGPMPVFSNGTSADMAWSDPLYIATSVQDNRPIPHVGNGFWSGDGGNTWAAFATLPPGAAANSGDPSNLIVTARNNVIWAPGDSVPSYTTNNGASWTATNLPAVSNVNGWIHAYRLKADRKNPNKVYAYDNGAQWWGSPGKVYVSTDGGHNFTLSQGSVAANMHANAHFNSAIEVNPNAEGDIWLADGNSLFHSLDSGATWTKLNNFASVGDLNQPTLHGAKTVALGKAAPGATYSAAVYVVGTINGVWGLYHSDDGGVTWTRFNDDAHQFGGMGMMAGDWNTYGRVYVAGAGRGVLYTN
jgi:xyloglucan-specific exo-beta-1,4-glucanase